MGALYQRHLSFLFLVVLLLSSPQPCAARAPPHGKSTFDDDKLSPRPALAESYRSLLLGRLPRGQRLPPSGPSRGTNSNNS
ncbi:hypothetical protein HPP92_018447 [Vanilla planifolia]|uniref:Uncharacterized protein n=1 Tax=Vanilla planifolia TaxID=51239 RepID=A0A835UMW5_VANPL|nr:hypothetical protein HPP92_019060 [Vanilla planifolia]KAG0469119.1 hypothetical protein HPP92_018447 [Vanilla planifolia]